jgi:RNA polymerase subunit RPABC4/transcription elongation factor Spt4
MLNAKQKQCPSCAGVQWWEDESGCLVCYNHRESHSQYDPRCPLCVVARMKAPWKALAIMFRRMLLPRAG